MNNEGSTQTIEDEDAAIFAGEAADKATIRAAYRAIAEASYLNPKLTVQGAILTVVSLGGELITYLVMELEEYGDGPAIWALSHIKSNYCY